MPEPCPYQFNSPVLDPATLVGRAALVDELVGHVASGGSAIVLGGWGLGETSVGLALAARLRQPVAGSTRRLVPVLLNPLEFGELHPVVIWRRLLAAYAAEGAPGTVDEARRALALLDAQRRDDAPFTASIKSAITACATASPELRLVLVFLEVDRLVHHPWTEVLFNNLRSLLSGHDAERGLAAVVAADPSSPELWKGVSSPFANIAKRFDLGPIEPSAVAELVAVGFGPDDAEAIGAELEPWTCGHPRLTQFALAELWQHRQRTGTTARGAELDLVLSESIPERLDRMLGRLWDKRPPVVSRLFRFAIKNGGYSGTEPISALNGNRKALREAEGFLKLDGFLFVERGQRARLGPRLVVDWFREREGDVVPEQLEIFVAHPFSDRRAGELFEGAEIKIHAAAGRPVKWNVPVASEGHGLISEDIVEAGLRRCDRFIGVVDRVNANVAYEFGFALGLGRPSKLLRLSSSVLWTVKGPLGDQFITPIEAWTRLSELVSQPWPQPSVVPQRPEGDGTLVLVPTGSRGEMYADVLRDLPGVESASTEEWSLSSLPGRLRRCSRVLWIVLDSRDGQHTAGDASNGAAAGFAVASGRSLRVLRSPDATTFADVAPLTEVFSGPKEAKSAGERFLAESGHALA